MAADSADTGGSTRIGGAGTGDMGQYVADTTGDDFFGGISGSIYRTTADMPLTNFVLSQEPFSVAAFFDNSIEAAKVRFASSPSLVSSIERSINDVRSSSEDKMAAAVSAAQEGFKLMFTTIPFMILFVMFSFQLLNLGYARLTDPLTANKFSVWAYVTRLIVFFIVIAFFLPVVRGAIEFSNSAANFLVSAEEQEKINTLVLYKMVATKPGTASGALGNILSYLMRALAYISVKILLILRDTLMAITVLVGPLCIAIGYFSSVTTPEGDPIRGYLGGWLENFVKLLFWGPFAAIMMCCMGVLTLINSLDGISLTYIVVASLAFFVASKSIPNLADKMSAVSVLAIMGTIMPAVGALTGGAVGMTGAAGWMAGTAGARGAYRFVTAPGGTAPVKTSDGGGQKWLFPEEPKQRPKPEQKTKPDRPAGAKPLGSRVMGGAGGGTRMGQQFGREMEGADGTVPNTEAPKVNTRPPTG